MKIVGIGNAIVDVICRVDDQYLTNNQLTKSTMKLVDESEFKKLLSTLNIDRQFLVGLLQTLLLDCLNWEMMLDL